MFFPTYVAAFFLPHENRSLPELLDLAGLTNSQYLDTRYKAALGILDPACAVVYGRWGAFAQAWARVDTLKGHTCLQIYFGQGHFHAQQANKVEDLPLEYDPTLPMAYTFRDACASLQPDAAFVDAQPHEEDIGWVNKQGNRAWVLGHYPMIEGWDVNALMEEEFSLLYLSDPLYRLCDPDLLNTGRDTIGMYEGYLVFARRGWSRWVT